MTRNSDGHALSRATTLLLAGLMVLSTVLFVAGLRLSEARQAVAIHTLLRLK